MCVSILIMLCSCSGLMVLVRLILKGKFGGMVRICFIVKLVRFCVRIEVKLWVVGDFCGVVRNMCIVWFLFILMKRKIGDWYLSICLNMLGCVV